MPRNVDVLLWSDNVITQSVKTALNNVVDITLFDQKHTYLGFFPDVVVLTEPDVVKMLRERLNAKNQYPDAKIIYIRKKVDITIISIGMLVGFDGLLDTGVKPPELVKMLHALGEVPADQLTQRRRSRILLDLYRDKTHSDLTCRQLAILSCLVRGLSRTEIAELLNTTRGDVYIAECLICKRLGITTKEFITADMIAKYGAVLVDGDYKHYKIPARLKRPGYYLLPRFYD